ncbi:IS1 family transposase, partial [Escherichia coli]
KACVLPENPASYRVVRTKSYLFNKAELHDKVIGHYLNIKHYQ